MGIWLSTFFARDVPSLNRTVLGQWNETVLEPLRAHLLSRLAELSRWCHQSQQVGTEFDTIAGLGSPGAPDLKIF